MNPLRILAILAALALATPAVAFDHAHAAWTELLRAHVKIHAGGNASAVDYAAMAKARPRLKAYLDELSAVGEGEYAQWNKARQLGFLINAYNAYTVELILTRYPDLASIKDLGSFLQSPWKKRFFNLLGKERSLDEIEHGMIRAPGAFDDPRIHVAVVCASIGCPMLRAEAYVAERLDDQLEDGMRRFLADPTRNRFDESDGRLRVSKIFDWYDADFQRGHKGIDSLKTLFARYARQLSTSPEGRARVAAGDYKIEHLEYDWRLNDSARIAAR